MLDEHDHNNSPIVTEIVDDEHVRVNGQNRTSAAEVRLISGDSLETALRDMLAWVPNLEAVKIFSHMILFIYHFPSPVCRRVLTSRLCVVCLCCIYYYWYVQAIITASSAQITDVALPSLIALTPYHVSAGAYIQNTSILTKDVYEGVYDMKHGDDQVTLN